ncbi:unnamed protein product [Heligmosomoides polygyrus]|uniref:Chorismate--pyruvate lyase n=1 Tax=Heligmosomoides polygyrus TaxID=6339 RepID=A0A183G0L4_HELPZ|nr:unnamed protein product [Heligmosomoides polygyrus]
MVRGNPKLSNKTITRLNELKTGARASKRNSIQAFGECFVPKPLTNLNDLIGCKSLHGDVVIKGETLRPPREPLRPFVLTGCVIVKRSKVENVDFLRNLEAIKEPAWLCKNVGTVFRMKRKYRESIFANVLFKSANSVTLQLMPDRTWV